MPCSEGADSSEHINAFTGSHLLAFTLSRTLFEPRQAEIRKECLRLWGVSNAAEQGGHGLLSYCSAMWEGIG